MSSRAQEQVCSQRTIRSSAREDTGVTGCKVNPVERATSWPPGSWQSSGMIVVAPVRGPWRWCHAPCPARARARSDGRPHPGGRTDCGRRRRLGSVVLVGAHHLAAVARRGRTGVGAGRRPVRADRAAQPPADRPGRRHAPSPPSDLGGTDDPHHPGRSLPRRTGGRCTHAAAVVRRRGTDPVPTPAARAAPTARHRAASDLAPRCQGAGAAGHRAAGVVAAGHRRSLRRDLGAGGFPPRGRGTPSVRSARATRCARCSRIGGCPVRCGSTTGRRGGRRATCPPIWRCG